MVSRVLATTYADSEGLGGGGSDNSLTLRLTMKLETKFNIGDVVYAAYPPAVSGPLTIGMVRVEHVDSRGLPGERTFSNYMPQKLREEQYMCEETGVRSGKLYDADRLFASSEEAESYLEKELCLN